MDRPDGLSEDALLDHLRGEGTPEEAARIEAAARTDPALRAELALMGGLRGALTASTDGPDTREFGWRRLEAEIARTAAPAGGRTGLWRAAAVVLGALVLGQGAYIALAPGTGGDALYRTVSEEGTGFGLGVAFVPRAPAGEIEALLRDAGARVVDGPTAIGFWRLAFEAEADRETGRAVLEASPLVAIVAEE